MPASNKRRSFRRNTKSTNKSTKRNSKLNGGAKTKRSKQYRKKKHTAGDNVPDKLTDEQIEEILSLYTFTPMTKSRDRAIEMLKNLKYENGYVSCYETEQDTENYKKNPRNLYQQAEAKTHCWFNYFTNTIE